MAYEVFWALTLGPSPCSLPTTFARPVPGTPSSSWIFQHDKLILPSRPFHMLLQLLKSLCNQTLLDGFHHALLLSPQTTPGLPTNTWSHHPRPPHRKWRPHQTTLFLPCFVFLRGGYHYLNYFDFIHLFSDRPLAPPECQFLKVRDVVCLSHSVSPVPKIGPDSH